MDEVSAVQPYPCETHENTRLRDKCIEDERCERSGSSDERLSPVGLRVEALCSSGTTVTSERALPPVVRERDALWVAKRGARLSCSRQAHYQLIPVLPSGLVRIVRGLIRQYLFLCNRPTLPPPVAARVCGTVPCALRWTRRGIGSTSSSRRKVSMRACRISRVICGTMLRGT